MIAGARTLPSPAVPAPSSGLARGARIALDLVALGLLLLYLAALAPRWTALQWDARTYLLAADAALAGGNPYRLADLEAVANGRPVPLPFLYPPVALGPFLALAGWPVAQALAFWLAAKLALLAGLVLLWKRLAPEVEWLPLALVAVFGCNGTALWDLRSGNVAIVEAALLWAGLACFARGHRGAFAAAVVLGACFKLLPAALLLLLLVPARDPARTGGRRGVRALLVAAAAFALLVFGPFVVGPAREWPGFLRHAGAATSAGEANPGLLAMYSALIAPLVPGASALPLAVLAWLATVALVLVASRRWLAGAWRAGDARVWALAAAWLFAMLSPRPMAYGLVLLLPAPLALAPHAFRNRSGRLLLALALAAQGLSSAARVPAEGPLLSAAPVLMPLAVWLLLVRAPAGGAVPGHVSATLH